MAESWNGEPLNLYSWAKKQILHYSGVILSMALTVSFARSLMEFAPAFRKCALTGKKANSIGLKLGE